MRACGVPMMPLSRGCSVLWVVSGLQLFLGVARAEQDVTEHVDLGQAVLAMNRELARHPECANSKPVLRDDMVAAIRKLTKPKDCSAEEFAAVQRVAETGRIPPHIGFRQFVRYHTGTTMQHGRWIRLVVQRESAAPLVCELRNEVLFERPLTQRERWAHQQAGALGGVGLINRLVTWFSEEGGFHSEPELSVDYQLLVNEFHAALRAQDLDRLQELVHWQGVSKREQKLVLEELQGLLAVNVHRVSLEPKRYTGYLHQTQATRSYEPNIPVEAYLAIAFSPKNQQAPETREQHIWLELGNFNQQPKIAGYVVARDRMQEIMGKPLSGPLQAGPGFVRMLDENSMEMAFDVVAPKEFKYLEQANLELWKRRL